MTTGTKVYSALRFLRFIPTLQQRLRPQSLSFPTLTLHTCRLELWNRVPYKAPEHITSCFATQQVLQGQLRKDTGTEKRMLRPCLRARDIQKGLAGCGVGGRPKLCRPVILLERPWHPQGLRGLRSPKSFRRRFFNSEKEQNKQTNSQKNKKRGKKRNWG